MSPLRPPPPAPPSSREQLLHDHDELSRSLALQLGLLCGVFERMRYGERVNPVIGVVAGGLMSVGFTADVGPGFFVGPELRFWDDGNWGFVVTGELNVLFPTKAGIRTSGKPMNLTLITGGLAPCLRYKWVLGCAVLDGGTAVAGGPGPLYFPVPPLTPQLGVGPRVALDLPLFSRFGARAFAEMRFSPLATYVDNEGKRVWTDPVVSGFFGLGGSFK